jgi:isoquinoline 1-oxidoreductase subunit beta
MSKFKTPSIANLSRRQFLQGSAATTGGLVLGFYMPGRKTAYADTPGDETGRLNGYVQIDYQGVVTVTLVHAEMGQGVYTSLPMIVAEELEADWQTIRVIKASGEKPGPVAGAASGTGGSRSIRGQFDALSRVGASAREMLRQAAANRWNVPLEDCIARHGSIHAGDRVATYGDLAMGAAMLAVPQNVPLKARKDWTLMGKPTKRLDSRVKVTGEAVFGVDVVLDNMLVGTVQQCPVWGGSLTGVDPAPAMAIAGVEKVITTDTAIIVVGSGYWPAKKGLDALSPDWDFGKGAGNNTQLVGEKLDDALNGKTALVMKEGNVDQANKFVSTSLEAVYEVPFLHQATMEPMNATAWVHDGKIEVWAPVQSAGRERFTIAQEFGVNEDDVTVHVTFLGGGFGRRSSIDFISPAIIASKNTDRPVKVIWSREEDMAHGLMRPVAKGHFKAGLNGPGQLVSWDSRLAVPSISRQLAPDRVNDGLDPVSVYGADNLPYKIPHQRLRYAMPELGVPLGFWRSVPHSYTAFFVESFLDEVAHKTKTDPFVLREQLMLGQDRQLRLLARLKQESGWADEPEKGHFRGMAFHECFGSIIGQVLELSMHDDQAFRIERVTAVVDCGAAINPLTIEAQIQGGIVYALTAAMFGRIDVADGRAVQQNFDSYQMVKMAQMPPVDVHILENGPIGGIGEPGVPPLAPALTNALFAATGTRHRKLPLMDAGLTLMDRH